MPAARALVTIDGSSLELPEHLEGVLPVYDDIAPTLVFLGESVADWSTLQRLSPAICELLGQPSLTAELRLTLRELESIIGPELATPTISEYARALHLSQDSIRDTLQAVRADLAKTRHFLVYAIAFRIANNVLILWPLLTSLGSFFAQLESSELAGELPWAAILGFVDELALMATIIWLARRHERRRREQEVPKSTPLRRDIRDLEPVG